MSPTQGVQAGGTLLTIKGTHLDTGRDVSVNLEGSESPLPCRIQG